VVGTFDHHFDELGEARVVLAQLEEALDEEGLVVAIALGVEAADELDVFAGELERRRLELPPARRYAQQEAVVDVDDVALHVQQDVAIVSILRNTASATDERTARKDTHGRPCVAYSNLEEIAEERVAGEALDKVVAGGIEGSRTGPAVGGGEVAQQRRRTREKSPLYGID
jgi:hypothetical protein